MPRRLDNIFMGHGPGQFLQLVRKWDDQTCESIKRQGSGYYGYTIGVTGALTQSIQNTLWLKQPWGQQKKLSPSASSACPA